MEQMWLLRRLCMVSVLAVGATGAVEHRASSDGTAANANRYEPNWPSLMTRPLPQWFDDSKIGVFIHWGVFSVPAFGSEWYWWDLRGDIAVPDTEARAVRAFHNKTYGFDYQYTSFAPHFTAELWDSDAWAALFAKAGIKYVVLTSKHHEGWCNWCSPEAFGWNACDNGPHRDLVGELTTSVRNVGLHMGLYHSIFEWFHPLYLADKANNFTTSRYVDEVYLPQAKEINNRYEPDLIWSDGDWEANSSYWKSPEFLAWLYNDAPNKQSVIVNDRWGSDNPPIASGKHFGGYFSGGDRQQASPTMLVHKWENAFTIDSLSWGFARNDGVDLYLNMSAILYEVVSTVAYGGNALINIGPNADGTIAVIFQERLTQLGAWLDVNGDAIYGTRMWREQNDTATHGMTNGVYYTTKGSDVFAITMAWPAKGMLSLQVPKPTASATATMLGLTAPIECKPTQGVGQPGLTLMVPPLDMTELPSLTGPWVFKLSSVL